MRQVWENPEIQSLNRLPMRSPLIPYEDAAKAERECAAGPEAADVPDSAFYKNLDGLWDFYFTNSPEIFPDANTQWRKIKVPLSWTMQGYSAPHYTNVQMPFDCPPPAVPEKNPTGYYRLRVDLPSAWNGRRVVLHVGSAESCAVVYVNGIEAGVSKDTRLPCEFDITPFLGLRGGIQDAAESGRRCGTPSAPESGGKTEIVIKVVRWSDASYVEDQDQWWFGGIHRSVYLYSTEAVFIQDAKALPTVGRANGGVTGVLPLEVRLGFAQTAAAPSESSPQKPRGILPQSELDKMEFTVKYKVCELSGTAAHGKAGAEKAAGEIRCGLDIRNTLAQASAQIEIADARLWSAETPSLYVVTVSLYSADGRHMESASFTCGFRTTEVRNRELLFNGKKIYIHGVNRHEHSEYNAKTLSTAEMARDVRTLKKYNFNAVRACHYPNDERWYELCDRYGIYVLDEANIENHAFYDVMSRSELWLNAYMQRIQRMAIRDKNHACVFGWSLGNESGNGWNLAAASAWLKNYDPTRIIHYEGFVRPRLHQGPYTAESLSFGRGLADLNSPMYPPIDLIVEYAKTGGDGRPMILCEYSHAMGNANGSLADYWQAFESTPGLQGGFIWDWIDQGIASDAGATCAATESAAANTAADGAKCAAAESADCAKTADCATCAAANTGAGGDRTADCASGRTTAAAAAGRGKKYWKYGGDFGDSPTDYDFCLNGLNFPDQTPKPAMEECRRLFAPVRLREIHAAQGIFEVENRFAFTTLDILKMNWSLLSNGSPCAGGTVAFGAVPPGGTCGVEIAEIRRILAETDGARELVFHAEFVYSRATDFAEAGEFCSADEAFVRRGSGRLEFTDGAKKISDGARKLAESFEPTIFRAFLENEGIKAYFKAAADGLIPDSVFDGPSKQWLLLNLPDARAVKVRDGVFRIESEKAGKKIEFGTCEYSAEEISEGRDSFIRAGARLILTDAVKEYPRAGLTAAVSAKFTKVRWYGAGPHECYSDRRFSALTGMYEAEIRSLGTPYIVPQENGSRCGVKYLELLCPNSGGNSGCGTIHIQSDSEFSFSILPYTAADLFKCRHTSELTDLTESSGGESEGRWILTIDAAHRGVGTGACGPDTLEKYRIRPGVYTLDLRIW